MNQVHSGSFLPLHDRLSGPDGADVVNTFGDKPATLSLGSGQLAPAMESRLIGLAAGAHERFALAPGEAFGPRNPDMVQRVPLAWKTRTFERDGNKRFAMTIPWGDVYTAFVSTGIPNIEVYMGVPPVTAQRLRRLRWLAPVLGSSPGSSSMPCTATPSSLRACDATGTRSTSNRASRRATALPTPP